MKLSSSILATAAIISTISSSFLAAATSIRGGVVDATTESASENVVASTVDGGVEKKDNNRGLIEADKAVFQGTLTAESFTLADRYDVYMTTFINQDSNGKDVCQHASARVIKKDGDTGIQETLQLSFAIYPAPQIATSFLGEDFVFDMDDAPSNKAGGTIKWNGVKFSPKEMKKIATASKGKNEKFEVLGFLASAGVFNDKCDGAAEMLTLAQGVVQIG